MTSHAQPAPLRGGQLVLGTVALSLATFMNVLDTSIANVSIPAISGDLGVSASQGTWVITSFAVANAISVPLTGWLTERFGQVRLFISSILLFVISSWLCGMAPTLGFLLAARVLQGAVAGPMIPLSQSLLLSSYPQQKSAMALSMWGMTTLVAPVLGPILGGWISDNYQWPWIFYINIPIGILAASVTWSIYRTRESQIQHKPIDKVGLTLLVLWVGSLQIMLDKGKELDWFNSTTIVALALVAIVSFAFFIVWEITEKYPVVDLTLFKGINFTGGVVAISVGYGLFFGNLVILPQWLQIYLGYTATQAGLILAPVGLFAILLSPVIGKTLPKVDARWIVTASFALFALVFYMRSEFNTQVDVHTLLIPTFLQGIPMSMFFIPLTAIILSGLPARRIPAAAGLSNFVRILCGGVGTSITATLWDNRISLHHAQLTESANVYNPIFDHAVNGLTTLGLSHQQAYGMIDGLITNQSAMLGANDIFWISAVLFILMIGLVWFTRPIRSSGGADVAAGAH